MVRKTHGRGNQPCGKRKPFASLAQVRQPPRVLKTIKGLFEKYGLSRLFGGKRQGGDARHALDAMYLQKHPAVPGA